MRFIVVFSSMVDTFELQVRDSLYASQLWSRNKQWTDIELQVGDKTFSVHRALLAARCPILAASIPSESLSTPFQIGDVDPLVFEELLYFLYTGQLRVNDLELLQRVSSAAERFRVETLQKLGKRTRFPTPNEISKTLIRFVSLKYCD